jgi:AraC-like DNA-binding protein
MLHKLECGSFVGSVPPVFPEAETREPFHTAHPEVGAVAHLSVRRRQVLHRPRFDLASIILVLEGRKCVVDQAEPIEIDLGEAILVPAGAEADVVNAPAATGVYRAIVVGFAPALLADFSRSHATLVAGHRPIGRIVLLRDTADVTDAMRRAVKSLGGETSGGPDLLRHRLVEILILLAERGMVFDGSRPLRMSERVGAHVARDVARPWTAGELARDLALSEATLRRRLAMEGTSFSRVLAETRLGHALFLLQASERSIVQIALDVGYRSPSRFATRFRARYGTSPSQIR